MEQFGAGRWPARRCGCVWAWLGLVAVWSLPLPVPAAAAAAAAAPAASPTLKKIRARGEVTVGVRTDFPPFGWKDAKGRLRGLEADLAQDLAEQWQVRLRLVPVTGEDRYTRLREGAVDVLIASAADTPARQMHAAAVEPPYYGSGVDVLLRPERHETRWLHLRGSALCAVQDAPFNAQVTQRHHVGLQTRLSLSEALKDLHAGRCEGLLYTEATVQHLRRLPDWSAYRAPLTPMLVSPWAISIARSEQGTALEREIGDAVARWHREGTLIDLERKWGLKPSAFLRKARAHWGELQADGSLVCTRDAQGRWPGACRGLALAHPLTASPGLRVGSWARQPEVIGFLGLMAVALAAAARVWGPRGWRAWRAWFASTVASQLMTLGRAVPAQRDPTTLRRTSVRRAARPHGTRPIWPRRRSLRRQPIRP